MKIIHLLPSISFFFIPQNSGNEITESKQGLNMILIILSQLTQNISIDTILIALLLFLFAYLLIKYRNQLFSYEKFQLAVNILYQNNAPLMLLRTHLEDIVSKSPSEQVSKDLNQILEYTNHIINCNRNILALNKVSQNDILKGSTSIVDLYTYIVSVSKQCQPYASSRQIQLNINKSSDYISCEINKTTMTAVIQHLLNKTIELSPANSCISITISHAADNYWRLFINNCKTTESESKKTPLLISILSPIYKYTDIRTVKKIIHLHGGKIIGYSYGKAISFQVIIPINCNYQKQTIANISSSITRKVIQSTEKMLNSNETCLSKNTENYIVLLIMDDNQFSSYLQKTLSRHFQIFILENPDLITEAYTCHNPDIIIIDKIVNGMYGSKLSTQIKNNKTMMNTPIILLINSTDNESCLSHITSKADRLEPRMVDISILRANICLLIDSYTAWRERIKILLANNTSNAIPQTTIKDDGNLIFMNKVQELLEKNMSTEGYTVDMLSASMGMCRTRFYNRIKEITGKSPIEYMFSFKMDKAKTLLASQQYSVSEIAAMLGYCDAKYFGKKFKDFYQICPTKYIKSIIG